MTILVRMNRGSCRSRAQTSNPLMSGRCTSRRIRSGSSASAWASAVSPSQASVTLMRPSSSVRRTRSITCGSSSAMRIVSIASIRGKSDAKRIGAGLAGKDSRGRPAKVAVCPPRQAAADALLHLDGALHGGMQSAPVLVDAGRNKGLRVALPLEEHRRPLLARGERDLVGRVIAVGPRHVLAGSDRELGRSEIEAGDPDVAGARLHRDRGARGLSPEPGERDHVVLLGVRLVALEARLVVRLVVELQTRGERRVLPLAIADVVRVFGAQAVRFSMTVTPTRSPLMNRPLGSFTGLPAASTWAWNWTSVSTVPLGMGLPSRTAFTASGVPYNSRYCLLS